jgi:hypothetical protein
MQKFTWEKSSSPLEEKWCANYYSTRGIEIFQFNQSLLVLVDVKVVFGEYLGVFFQTWEFDEFQ